MLNQSAIEKQFPITEVVCAGTARQMGIAQGAALRRNICDALRAIGELEAFRLMKPNYIPFPLFRRIAEYRAARFLSAAFRSTPLDTEDRFQGISEGAKISHSKLAICSLLEVALSDLVPFVTDGPNGIQAGCSAVAVAGRSSANDHPIIAHNFDYLPIVQPHYFVRHSRPTGKLRSVEFAISPLAGTIDGVNEAGLAITCNYAYVTDPISPAPTITMLIAETLASARTVDEAYHFFANRKRAGGGLLMLSDEQGTISSFELSNTQIQRIAPSPGRETIHHTNRVRGSKIAGLELKDQAYHGANAPRTLRGVRVHQSADQRSVALERRLNEKAVFNIDDIHAAMSDHGDGASADSVCMHGNYWNTTACTQLLSKERKLRVSFSSACNANFQEFEC
jgi:hypothetical protein